MKNIIFTLSTLITLFSVTDVFATDKPFVIVGDTYPPYSYIENGEFKGTDVDIIKAAFDRMNIKPLFKFRPWSRAMTEVKSGKSDAIYSLFKTKERESFLNYPQIPLGYEKNILVVNDISDKRATSLEDIKGWDIGVVVDNSYGKIFDEYKDIVRVEAKSNQLLILQLNAKKRFDAIIINELLFDTMVNQFVSNGDLKKTNFRKLEYVPNNAPLYMGFSKNSRSEHKQIVERFSDALLALKNEGVIDKIVNQYSNQITMKEMPVTD